MAFVATISVVWIGFGSVADVVGGDGCAPVSFSITASTIVMGHSVPTSTTCWNQKIKSA